MNITQNHIAEGCALLICVISWNTVKKGGLRWLPFFLFFVLCVELAGAYFKKVPYANAKLYNFSIPLEYLFYFLLFNMHGKKILKTTSFICALCILSIAIYFFLVSPFREFHAKVLLAGQVAVIVCCCLYFIEKFKNVEEESLFRDPFFWIVSGLLLFNLEDFVYFLLYDLIKANNWDPKDKWFKAINNSLLILLYLSYIIAVLVDRRNRKTHAP